MEVDVCKHCGMNIHTRNIPDGEDNWRIDVWVHDYASREKCWPGTKDSTVAEPQYRSV